MKRWYVLYVLTGTESDVVSRLVELGVEAAVPRQIKLLRRGGQWCEESAVLLPGYVFAELDYDANVHHLVKGISNVVYLLPRGDKPMPLLPEECNWLLCACGAELSPSHVDFSGKKPRVVDGPLLQWQESIVKFDRHRRRALLHFPMLGRPHEMWLSILPT